MPKYVRFENDQDYQLVLGFFERSIIKMKADPAKYDLEQVESFYRVVEALKEAKTPQDAVKIGVPKETVKHDVEKAAEAKRTRKSQAKPKGRSKFNLCKTHPYNSLQRVPSTDCEGCWAAYKKLHPTEWQNKRREFDRKQRSAS